jgi:hypothetical protein
MDHRTCRGYVRSKLKLGITILAFTAAGCAGHPTTSAAAGGTQAPAVDAAPVRTVSGDPVILRSSAPVSGRDWNCARCYK